MMKCICMPRRSKKFLVFIAVVFFVFTVNQAALAINAGITIQTDRGGYAGTQPLTEPITDQLDVHTDSDDKMKIIKTLNLLQDGDVLVLSVHSNPSVFAIGGETVQWGRFWEYFGIENPPKLGIVIVGGCMAREFEFEEETEYIPVTDEEQNFIRRHLSTGVLFLPKAEVHKATAINDINGLLGSILKGKKLSEINLQNRWNYVTAPEVDRDNINWGRKHLDFLNCLCECLEPEGGRFSCSYNTTDRGWSPSCRDLSNGPCICKAHGCFRASLPTEGECYDSCYETCMILGVAPGDEE